MRIAIFGTGGAAGYFGARLAEAGEEVFFIARGEHLRAIRQHGLRVESINGDVLIHPAHATNRPEEIGPVDLVLLGVKTWQVEEAAREMRPLVGGETIVIPLQNGVETADQLAGSVGQSHVIGGLANIFSFIAGPGHIRHVGGPARITFGELAPHSGDRVEQLRQVFARTRGVEVATPDQIRVALWEKFLFVVPLGAIGAVTRAPIGVFRDLAETRWLLEQAMREIFELARLKDIPLANDLIDRTMQAVDRVPPDGTTSLQRDIMAGRPSELEAWSGAVVRLAQEVRLATPTHAFCYHTLLPQERRARGELQFSLDAAS